jgi:hypothetical protein
MLFVFVGRPLREEEKHHVRCLDTSANRSTFWPTSTAAARATIGDRPPEGPQQACLGERRARARNRHRGDVPGSSRTGPPAHAPMGRVDRRQQGPTRDHPRDGRQAWHGLPIATGVIEGACRNLVKDRMDRGGARWTLTGAEAVLRLRALRASGDFDAYWQLHLGEELRRHHAERDAGSSPPDPLQPLRRVK